MSGPLTRELFEAMWNAIPERREPEIRIGHGIWVGFNRKVASGWHPGCTDCLLVFGVIGQHSGPSSGLRCPTCGRAAEDVIPDWREWCR